MNMTLTWYYHGSCKLVAWVAYVYNFRYGASVVIHVSCLITFMLVEIQWIANGHCNSKASWKASWKPPHFLWIFSKIILYQPIVVFLLHRLLSLFVEST
jgi:hypothetical protein